MFVYRAAPGSDTYSLVLSSTGPDANEVTTSTSVGSLTVGAKFKVYILGCGVDGSGTFTLFGWGLTGTPSNAFTAAPTAGAVTVGQTVPVMFGWSGLPAGNRYLGRVQYTNPAVIGQTIIGVSTR